MHSIIPQGVLGGERCISGRRLTIYNTRRDLLVYVQSLLGGFDIESLPLRINSRAGTWLRDPRTRRSYRRKRNCLTPAVRARSLPKFTQCIGFYYLPETGMTSRSKQVPMLSGISFSRPRVLIFDERAPVFWMRDRRDLNPRPSGLSTSTVPEPDVLSWLSSREAAPFSSVN